MIAAALMVSQILPIPPVVRDWKKGAKANFWVYETMGEDEGKIDVRYLVQIKIKEPGTAIGRISRRTFTVGGKGMSGITARTDLTFTYDEIGPVPAAFDRGLGGGNAVIWALSSPGWGGTGFKGEARSDGWHGSVLFGDPSGSSTVGIKTHLRKDAWPQKVEVVVSTSEGGYSARIEKI